MKLFREDVAIKFAQTLLTSDQRELLRVASLQGLRTADAIAITAFELADAFIKVEHGETDEKVETKGYEEVDREPEPKRRGRPRGTTKKKR